MYLTGVEIISASVDELLGEVKIKKVKKWYHISSSLSNTISLWPKEEFSFLLFEFWTGSSMEN